MISFKPFVLLCIMVMGASVTYGAVGDPQIMTDHPIYRGELSCSTIQRNIEDAYRVFQDRYGQQPNTDTEKLLSIWAWISEHYMHNSGNIVYYGPNNPDAIKTDLKLPWAGSKGWMDNKDCLMNQFSFSFGLCYSVHAHISILVGKALGDMRLVRCPEIKGHTPFEAFVDGRWVLADLTMGLMVFDDTGKPIGLNEIYTRKANNDKAWFSNPKRGGKYKFHMSPFGDRLDWYTPLRWQQPLFGYNAMPIVYSLRSGESFTRYLDPGLEDGKTWIFWGRDYYKIGGRPKHGPYRNVTFLDDPPIGNMRRGRGRAYYGNGVFEYIPPLADGRYKQGVKKSNGVTFNNGALRGLTAGAYVAFEHVSPYIIAARSIKGGDREWELLKEKCADGAIVSGKAIGKVPIHVSINGGQSWRHVGVASDQFKIDFTDIVKGRHAYLLGFVLSESDGLEALQMRTVTQVGRGVFPRLKDGGTTITYQSSGLSPIHGGPAQYLADRFRRRDLETDGYQVYQIEAPGPICQASGAARVSGPKGTIWSVDFSLDGGTTWRVGAKDLQVTGEGKIWEEGQAAYVSAEMNFPKNKANKVLVRFGKGNILHGQVFATYKRPNDSDLTVTYGWTEKVPMVKNNKIKEYSHTIKAGQTADTWTIPSGIRYRGTKTKWVRFKAE